LADAPPAIIVALSGRALAAAARRAGCRTLVLDLFGDRDTRRLAWRSLRVSGGLARGFDEASLLAGAARLRAEAAREGFEVAGLIYGAGFEDRPEVLARLGQRVRLLGNAPEVVAQVKDPKVFFPLLDRLGIPHPEIRLAPPARPRDWVVKRAAASGGGHIRPAVVAGALAEGAYFQRRAHGRAVSALFLAAGGEAHVLGFSAQWAAPAGPNRPFRFGGAVCPAELAPAMARRLSDVVARLAGQLRLVGINAADFLVREDGFDLLEVNPRPGATLDIFDRDPRAPLLALHLRACAGTLTRAWRPPATAAALALVYAPRRTPIPAGLRWPRWAADLPEGGAVIARGAPVCTVLGRGRTPTQARARALARVEAVLSMLARGGRPAARPPSRLELQSREI